MLSPTTSPAPGSAPFVPSASPSPSIAPIQQVAEILHLPVTEALTRLVTEYTSLGSLALQGCADAAREWIDDRTRNRSNKRMTVAFFRRWLKREQEGIEQRHIDRQHQSVQRSAPPATEPMGISGLERFTQGGSQHGGGQRLPSLMHLAELDQQARGAQC